MFSGMYLLLYVSLGSSKVFSVIPNAICRSSSYKNYLPEWSRCWVHIGNVSSASKRSCAYDPFFCFVLLNQESIGLFSLAYSLKAIIATRQHSTDICNASRYCSVVYWVGIIWLIHFMIEICVFLLWCLYLFYRYTDVFLFCVFWSYTRV